MTLYVAHVLCRKSKTDFIGSYISVKVSNPIKKEIMEEISKNNYNTSLVIILDWHLKTKELEAICGDCCLERIKKDLYEAEGHNIISSSEFSFKVCNMCINLNKEKLV